MKLETAVAELRALAARATEIAEALERPEASQAEPRLPAVLAAPHYARHRGLDSKTIHRYAALGMPHYGAGKALRVRVAEADAWIKGGGPKRAREKARAAGAQDAAAKALQ